MVKVRYRYNPESLSYDKIKKPFWTKFLIFLSYFFVIVVVAIALNLTYGSLFDTPKEKRQKREIAQLKLQYELINAQVGTLEAIIDDIEKRDDNIYRTIFNAEPIPSSVRDAGYGGVNRYEDLEGFDYSDVVIQTKQRLDRLTKSVYVQSKSYDEVVELALRREEQLASIPAIMPISNDDLTRTASGWGYRIHPIYKIRRFHYGMDFTAPTGTEVYASGDGVVKRIERSRRGYGNKLIIDHGFGYETLYAHLNDFNVRRGQKVKRGDIIAFVGSTGLSTAPHLHYEVHVNNKKVNPIYYYFNDLTSEEWDRMIELSMRAGQSFD